MSRPKASVAAFVILLAACSPDSGLTKSNNKFNNEPVAVISSHSDGDTEREGYLVTFQGSASDTNNSAGELLAGWYSGSDVICEEAAPDMSGLTRCEAVLDTLDADISLQVRDPSNATAVARVSLVITATDAPVADIQSPDGLSPAYTDQPIAVVAVVSDGEDAAPDLQVAWTDEAGAALDIDDSPDVDGGLAGTLPALSAGSHRLTLTVTDSTGKVGVDSVDLEVAGPNQAPACEIIDPADGAVGGLGEESVFTGLLTDPDVDGAYLSAAWSSDADGALGTSEVDSEGRTVFRTAELSVGAHLLTLTGIDEVGATCTDSLTFLVGTPPEVIITLPLPGAEESESAIVPFEAMVDDDVTPPDALDIVWESDIDGVIDETPADSSGFVSWDTGSLSVGDHLITVTVTDSDGFSAVETVELRIDGAPSAPEVDIEPSDPADEDDLVAAIITDSVDPEGDTVSYT